MIIDNEVIERYGKEMAMFIYGIVYVDGVHVSNNPDLPIYVTVNKDTRGLSIVYNNRGEHYIPTVEYSNKCYKLLSLTIKKLHLITVPLPSNHKRTHKGFNLGKLNYLNDKFLLCVDDLDTDRVLCSLRKKPKRDIVTVIGKDFSVEPYCTRELLGMRYV